MDKLKKILVVEDDAVGRKLLAIYLRGACDVDFADDLEEGIQKLQSTTYDLVITDMNLGMEVDNSDGMKLLRFVRSIDTMKHIPVIGVTAHMIIQDMDYYKKLGFDDFMKKPIFKEAFISHIKNLLGI